MNIILEQYASVRTETSIATMAPRGNTSKPAIYIISLLENPLNSGRPARESAPTAKDASNKGLPDPRPPILSRLLVLKCLITIYEAAKRSISIITRLTRWYKAPV